MLKKNRIKIPVEISARHIHLSQKDLDKLFNKNYKLTKLRDLSQPGEFAAEEKVVAVKNKTSPQPSPWQGDGVSFRIVGPVREESQIEISKSEADKLGIKAPLRMSGDLKGVKSKLEVYPVKSTTSGRGAKQFDRVKIKAIRAQRHLHCSKEEAKKLGIKNNQKVKVKVDNEKGMIFNNVIVRVGQNYSLACHLDIDEANVCGLGKVCGSGYLLTH